MIDVEKAIEHNAQRETVLNEMEHYKGKGGCIMIHFPGTRDLSIVLSCIIILGHEGDDGDASGGFERGYRPNADKQLARSATGSGCAVETNAKAVNSRGPVEAHYLRQGDEGRLESRCFY